MPLDLDMDAPIRAMGGGSLTALQRAWLTLGNARGRLVLWDYSTDALITYASGKINILSPRAADTSFGSWQLIQTQSARRPPRDAVAPSGLLGASYDAAALTMLSTQGSEGAQLVGTMSSLTVCSVSAVSALAQRVWGPGSSSLTTQYIGEQVAASGSGNLLAYSRVNTNNNSVVANDLAAHIRTTTYDAGTQKVNSWLDSTQILTNVTNATTAPSCDIVAHGGKKASTDTQFMTGAIWLQLLASVVWTAPEIATYMAAAKLIAGTP